MLDRPTWSKATLLFAVVAATTLVARPDVARAGANSISNIFVTNDAAHPLPVNVVTAPPTDAVSEPVTLVAFNTLAGNAVYLGLYGSADPYVVPAGKRLVVEYVNVASETPPGVSITYLTLGEQVGSSRQYVGSLPTLSSAEDGTWRFNQLGGPVRYYFEAGTSLYFTGSTSVASAAMSLDAVVVGHLVDAR